MPESSTPERSRFHAALILGSFTAVALPFASAAALSRFDSTFIPLWALGSFALGTVLLLVTGLRFPKFVAIGGTPLFAVLVPLAFDVNRQEFVRPAELLISRDHLVPVALAVGVWVLLVVTLLWRSRRHWVMKTAPVSGPAARPRGALRRVGDRAILAVLVVALAAGAAWGGWTTVWNTAHLAASATSSVEVRVVGQGMYDYNTGARGGRTAGVYWVVEDEAGRQGNIKPLELLAWEWSTKLTWDEDMIRSGSCTKTDVEVGDVLTLAGRQGAFGFAVDYVEAVTRGGQEICRAEIPPVADDVRDG